MSSSPRSTTRKLIASLAVLAAVGTFVSFGVFSSFSQTQSNSSSLQAGSLTLVRDTPTTLINSLLGLIPGDIVTRCVKVTKGGDIASTVTLTPTVTSLTGAGTVANALQVSIESGTGLSVTDGTCTGFTPDATPFLLSTTDVTSFGGAKTLTDITGQTVSYSAGSWANGTSKMYRVRVALPTSNTTIQGLTGTFNLAWQADQPAGDTGR